MKFLTSTDFDCTINEVRQVEETVEIESVAQAQGSRKINSAEHVRADVWKYFEKAQDNITAVFRICKTRLKAGTTTTSEWISHVEGKHQTKALIRKLCPAS